MQRLTLTALALGTAALLSACVEDREAEDATTAAEELEQPVSTPTGETLVSGEFDDPEGVEGDAEGRFELRADAAGATTLMVELEELAPGEHAWHIHEGDCSTEGPVAIAFTQGADATAVPGAQALMAAADGRATATVTIPEAELQKLHQGMSEQPATPPTTVTPPNSENAPVDRPVTEGTAPDERKFSIHVHQRGGTDHGPTVACANLDVSRLRDHRASNEPNN